MAESIRTILTMGPVIPVLTIERAEDAVPLAEALVKGGLRALEITLRTPAAFDAIAAIASGVAGAIVGAGTVLEPDQLQRAATAGVRFLVAPGLSETMARAAQISELPFLPGVATASEIMHGLELGLSHFKFFPAESAGGVKALAAFEGPFPNVSFCPTGGVTAKNARDYLALSNVSSVGGSWVAPKDAVLARDWSRIETLAREAAGLGHSK